MIELIAIFFFSKKIREICEQKGVKAGKWVAILIGAWFGSEILVFMLGIYFLGASESSLLQLVIPALIAAISSALFVLQKVKSLESENEDLTLDEFASNDEQFKHFR